MKKTQNSRGAIQPEISDESMSKWVPDVYYFPTQVEAELTDIQNNVLGKVLTLVDALGLEPKQEKATKDLIRTIIKEQMIRSRRMLDGRLETLLKLGMKPVNTSIASSDDGIYFTKHYRVQYVYDSDESLEGDGDGKIKA